MLINAAEDYLQIPDLLSVTRSRKKLEYFYLTD